jgi:hypothetical protein
MLGYRPGLALTFASLFLIAAPTAAHDSWISRGALRNAAGEWCCGEGDCFVIPGQNVRLAADGYHLFEVETVPFSETQPLPDGAFWRCKRPEVLLRSST